MSYTEIKVFGKDGTIKDEIEINNSWRFGMAIWMHMENKYLPLYIPEYAKHMGIKTKEQCERTLGFIPTRCSDFTNEKAIREIWDLVERGDVSFTDKVCMFCTFDRCLVKKEDFGKIIKAFRDFEGESSLKEQADEIEKLMNDDCIAIGWGHSQNSSYWDTQYDENDNKFPYNCLTMDNHYWLFDELKEENK